MAVALSDAYWSAMKVSLAFQGAAMAVVLLDLDHGYLTWLGGYAMIAFWIGAAVVIVRRPAAPRRSDLAYVRWAYPVLLGATTAITAAVIAYQCGTGH